MRAMRLISGCLQFAEGDDTAPMEMLAVVFGASAVAGVVQSVTGFGAGIVMMLFFPLLMPVLNASALSGAISMTLAFSMAWKLREKIRWRLLVLPGLFFAAASALSLAFADLFDTTVLLRIFGVVLLILSAYFLIFAGRLKVKASLGTAAVCATLSGVVGGLFGIGGPPMVVYYLAALDDLDEYRATIQAFFGMTNIFTFAMRLMKGLYTAEMLLPTGAGIAAILLGMAVGVRLYSKINSEAVRKLVYAFLGVTGIINLLK